MPALFAWNGSVSTDFDNPANWWSGTPNTIPGAGDDILYDPVPTGQGSISPACENVHGAAGGAYRSVTLNNSYSGTVTLSSAFTTEELYLYNGALSQPVGGTDITVTAQFTWTGGILNSSSNLATVSITSANPMLPAAALIDPGGGTLNLGSNISLVSEAHLTTGAGTINVTNDEQTIDVGEYCSFNVNPGAGLSSIIAGLSKHLVIRATGQYTLQAGADWDYSGDVTNYGTFIVKEEAFARIAGVPGNPYAYSQSGTSSFGATYLYGSSMLSTGGEYGVRISGGKLATMYASTERGANDCSADILTLQLAITGGDIYIGYGGAHLAFGTLTCHADVSWTGGTYHPGLRSYAGEGNSGESDVWYATRTFYASGEGGAAFDPILVDADGAVVYQAPPPGVSYVLLRSNLGLSTMAPSDPSYDQQVWIIGRITENGTVTRWDLTALGS